MDTYHCRHTLWLTYPIVLGLERFMMTHGLSAVLELIMFLVGEGEHSSDNWKQVILLIGYVTEKIKFYQKYRTFKAILRWVSIAYNSKIYTRTYVFWWNYKLKISPLLSHLRKAGFSKTLNVDTTCPTEINTHWFKLGLSWMFWNPPQNK